MRAILLAAALAFSQPAFAGWELSRSGAVATLAALDGPAALRVSCLDGRLVPALTFKSSIVPAAGLGDVRTVVRYDNEPPRTATVPLSANGRDLWVWHSNPSAGIRRLEKARRLRVQVSPQGADAFEVEFDLSGMGDTLRQLPCQPMYRKAPPMSAQ